MTENQKAQQDARLLRAKHAIARQQWEQAYDLCLAVLAEQNGNVEALVLLADIYQAVGRPDRSLQALQAAHHAKTDDTRLALLLAWQLAYMNQLSEALQMAESIDSKTLVEAEDWKRLGQLWTRLERHESAVDAYKQALLSKTDDPMLWHDLGNSLRFVGAFEDANRAYRQAVEIEPLQAVSWYALADLARESADKLDADLEEVLPKVTTHEDRIYMQHARYKTLERCKRYTEAFEALEMGNRLQKERLQFDFSEEEERMQAALNCPFEAEDAPTNNSGLVPIFVLGMPRTGTTLVDRIVSSHSHVHSLGELQHLAIVAKRVAGTSSAHLLDGDTLQAAAKKATLVGKAYLDAVGTLRGDYRYFVDSMPINFYFLPFLLQALPQARVICLQRHPMDACFSNYRQLFALNLPFYRYSYDLTDLGRFYPLFRELSIRAANNLDDRFMHLNYEDLVVDPEGTIRRVIAFCGLPWESACLNFHENASGVSTASSVQVREPVTAKYMGRWRHYADQLTPLSDALQAQGIEI